MLFFDAVRMSDYWLMRVYRCLYCAAATGHQALLCQSLPGSSQTGLIRRGLAVHLLELVYNNLDEFREFPLGFRFYSQDCVSGVFCPLWLIIDSFGRY